MIKKLLLGVVFLYTSLISNAQTMTNLVFDSQITPSTTSVSLTFDYSGVSTGDVFEWQLFLAGSDDKPDWGSGRNIAWQGNMVPVSVGSGTQTITLNIINSPVEGEVFTWTGKITLASDGSDTGFNNEGNLVTIVNTLNTSDIFKEKISFYPNPATDKLHIKNNGIEIKSFSIIDITGKKIYHTKNFIETIDISNLEVGFYFLRINNISTVKFIKK